MVTWMDSWKRNCAVNVRESKKFTTSMIQRYHNTVRREPFTRMFLQLRAALPVAQKRFEEVLT